MRREYLEERLKKGETLSDESPLLQFDVRGTKKDAFMRTLLVTRDIREAIVLAGLKMRPYVLRAYFSTALDIAESKGLISHPWRQFIMGHKGDIEARYSTNKRLPPDMIEEMRASYQKCTKYLETRVSEVSEDNAKIFLQQQLLSAVGYKQEEIDKIDLVNISKKYKMANFTVTDNILNPVYVTKMLTDLSDSDFEFNLFFEVKSALTKKQIQILSNAGVRLIQPGIESLSTHVLSLMRKGTTMLQNIQTMKWLKEFYIQPLWNILYGFPGEVENDYIVQEEIIPLIFHLTPPGGISNIEMHRFSPNFDSWLEQGFKDVRPLEDYGYIYPNNFSGIQNLAYYFDYDKEYQDAFSSHIKKISSLILNWKNRKRSINAPYLNYRNGPGFIQIYDNRTGEKKEESFSGIRRDIILFCDKIRSYNELVGSMNIPQQELNSALGELEEKGVIIREDQNYLSLPVRLVLKA